MWFTGAKQSGSVCQMKASAMEKSGALGGGGARRSRASAIRLRRSVSETVIDIPFGRDFVDESSIYRPLSLETASAGGLRHAAHAAQQGCCCIRRATIYSPRSIDPPVCPLHKVRSSFECPIFRTLTSM